MTSIILSSLQRFLFFCVQLKEKKKEKPNGGVCRKRKDFLENELVWFSARCAGRIVCNVFYEDTRAERVQINFTDVRDNLLNMSMCVIDQFWGTAFQ